MDRSKQKPVAFLCHGSEDKDVVQRLALDLMAKGVDVFFDDWEMRAGDSLRQKIDTGLRDCTHFVAVLSPTSITRPWVNAEMDAAFVRRMANQVIFIALRLGVDVTALPPLLQGMFAPSIDNYEKDVQRVISDILGLSRKPPLGSVPAAMSVATPGSGLSPAAEAIVRLFVERSEHGDSMDPEISVADIRSSTALSDDDIVDAVDELVGQGYAKKHGYIGCGELGFAGVFPEGELFARFDGMFMSWKPEADALVLATKLLDAKDQYLPIPPTATSLEWKARRMNAALHYLMNRGLVEFSQATGAYPWATHHIQGTPETRRFARSKI